MKFSQSKLMSIAFLLAIILIALMFSMYKPDGFYEGVRGKRSVNKRQDNQINNIKGRLNTLETNVNKLMSDDEVTNQPTDSTSNVASSQ